MARVVLEDENEESYAGYLTVRWEDDDHDLLAEAHVDPDIAEELDDFVTDPDAWKALEKVAGVYADLFRNVDSDGVATISMEDL